MTDQEQVKTYMGWDQAESWCNQLMRYGIGSIMFMNGGRLVPGTKELQWGIYVQGYADVPTQVFETVEEVKAFAAVECVY